MGRSRELLAGLVLAVVSVGLALVALEVGVRLMHLEPDRFWQPDPVLGSVHIPGKTGWWTQEDREFTVPVRISPEGWRDVPRAIDKPAGVFRILVLGDSFPEAMQVPLEAAFPRVLEEELNQHQSRRVEVINTGVSGYGTAAELLLLRRDGEQYHPDLVLLSFYPGNDVMNNSPELEDTLAPVYDATGAVERINAIKKDSDEATGAKGLLGRSQAYRYARRILLTGHPELAQRLVRWGLLKAKAVEQRTERDGIPTAYYVYGTPDAAWQAAWGHTERLLGDLQQETRRIGARVMVAIISNRDEVYPQWWQEVQHAYPAMQRAQWNIDAPREHVIGLCEAMGIPYLALTPIMRAAANGEPLHYHHDGHWTAAGHRIAGRELAKYILAKGLITNETEVRHEVH